LSRARGRQIGRPGKAGRVVQETKTHPAGTQPPREEPVARSPDNPCKNVKDRFSLRPVLLGGETDDLSNNHNRQAGRAGHRGGHDDRGPATANECIAPSNPGGGWDFTCRTIGRILTELDLVDGNVQITNMPGGVGAVTFAMVAAERSDDAELIVATSTVGITQIAQGRYPAPLDTMRYLAMLGADVGVIAVDDDSPIESLAELNAAMLEDPTALVTAGSSGAGGWDHIRLLMVADAAGVEDLRRSAGCSSTAAPTRSRR
jgi:hypothetical protein